jgi:membrane-associated phospholipid phosphatase
VKYILLILTFPAFLFSSDKVIGDVGTVLQYALPVAALTMTACYLDKEGNVQFIKAFAFTEATKETLKRTVRSTRPNGGKHSFPSGHTSCSFASSAFIQRRYGWKYGIPAYLIASYVAYTRIQVKAHRFRDVAAGAGLGILFNYIFTTPYCQAIPTAEGGIIAFNSRF